MLIKGRIIGINGSFPFTAGKEGERIELRVELPDGPLEYSVECSCLEPLELLSLLLPSIEDKAGEIRGIFVEEAVEDGGAG
ncbi:hypothetical protein [Thermococcus sp.]